MCYIRYMKCCSYKGKHFDWLSRLFPHSGCSRFKTPCSRSHGHKSWTFHEPGHTWGGGTGQDPKTGGILARPQIGCEKLNSFLTLGIFCWKHITDKWFRHPAIVLNCEKEAQEEMYEVTSVKWMCCIDGVDEKSVCWNLACSIWQEPGYIGLWWGRAACWTVIYLRFPLVAPRGVCVCVCMYLNTIQE